MVPLGHYLDDTGHSVFRVFAPDVAQLALQLAGQESPLPMEKQANGYWTLRLPQLAEGHRYRYRVNGTAYPDPASRAQPDGVHGPSAVAYPPSVDRSGWTGIAIEDAIIYELHLGTFTPDGTLAAATDKLPHLKDLGITVIELLPIAAFPGQRNWGYDGTYQFALQLSYGSYSDLKTFIETAHALGMAVILDVVYNHFGPEGNYSAAFAPYTKEADTPWGAAINFDRGHSEGIRAFYLANTRYWLQEIGFDGFRMDAVSLIFDDSPRHILREITDLAREIGQAEQRQVLMIAEHLRNEAQVTAADGLGYHSQWNDDLNHALFAYLTGEQGKHYSNFGSFDDIEKALRDSFVLDGTRWHHFYNRLFGTDGRGTAATEHVMHIQDHDQVGNRLHGDRMIASYGADKALLAVTAVLASPYVPMLFMGEEYGEIAPFLFFEDFGDAHLIEAVRHGRKEEFAFGGAEPRDAHDPSAFLDSKLDWSRLAGAEGQRILHYYRQLLAWKRSGELGPRDKARCRIQADGERRLLLIETNALQTWLNFADRAQPLPDDTRGRLLLSSQPLASPTSLPPFAAALYRR